MILPSVRAHLRAHGLEPTKALGQNFLLDPNICDKIVRAAGDLREHTVIEVGPGPGGLSRAILHQAPSRLIAVEQDPRLRPLLAEVSAAYLNFCPIYADALKTDLTKLGPPPRRLLANLPYNIATPLTLGWLKQWHQDPGAFASLTLMFQKEVVDRFVARPKTKAYGRLSVMGQWICQIEARFDLPPHLFLPAPKVVSTVAHFQRRDQPLGAFAAMERVVATAFGQRRKTLKKAMGKAYPHIDAVLADLGIPPRARAEELEVEQFCALAKALETRSPKN